VKPGGRAPGIVGYGLATGAVGGATVALWVLGLDTLFGHPFSTPAELGGALVHGGQGMAGRGAAFEVVAYTAFHFLAFATVGMGLAAFTIGSPRFPDARWLVPGLFLGLELGFLATDLALGSPGGVGVGTVGGANALASVAMVLFQRNRHARVREQLATPRQA
jgi:hypothetical protein